MSRVTLSERTIDALAFGSLDRLGREGTMETLNLCLAKIYAGL
jgi:hypothetical protein